MDNRQLEIKEAARCAQKEFFYYIKKVFDMHGSDREEAFGDQHMKDILNNLDDPADLIRKYKEWQEDQKKVKIGDEICYKICDRCQYFWVTHIESDWGYVAGVDKYGQVHTARDYTRTGNHNNSLVMLIEQLKLQEAPND